ncbi:hypothetical protein [Herbaspirillum robiniae]|uniref:ESPR domain-containing protein n=1 Tax=Herbaspirillum robiniae TaxID=2014887 RepID=A0ABX2M141_9BURK|nr:hypothetical protein [Herbaspirillum robiniae]NUU03704.1 hypothetical protein [Herbaspirillum robiniae]
MKNSLVLKDEIRDGDCKARANDACATATFPRDQTRGRVTTPAASSGPHSLLLLLLGLLENCFAATDRMMARSGLRRCRLLETGQQKRNQKNVVNKNVIPPVRAFA